MRSRGAPSSRSGPAAPVPVAVVVVGPRGVGDLVGRVLGGGSVEVDVAGVHAHDAGDDVTQGLELVGDDEHGRAAGHEAAEHLGEGELAGGVDAGGRLVHDEHLGAPGQGPGDEHPALLPAGEPGDLLLRAVGEPDRLDGLADHLAVDAPLGPPPRAVGEPPDLDDLGDRRAHRPRERVVLGDVPDLGVVVELGAGHAEQPHATALLLDEAEHAAHERRLAGPVGPEQGDDLAATDHEVDAVDDPAVAVAEGRPVQLEQWCLGTGQRHRCPSSRIVRLLRMTSR